MDSPQAEVEDVGIAHTDGNSIPRSAVPNGRATSFNAPMQVDEAGAEQRIDYGYRYVKKIGRAGEERWIKVPLTRDDVLHPKEGDHQLHNDPHQVFCLYLYMIFKSQLEADVTAVVFHDTGVFWDDPVLDHNSPDVAVILGVRKQQKWTTFHVAEEGVRPELVVEVTSPSTWTIDLQDKREIYAKAGVPFYVIVETDRRTGTRPLRLLGYALTEGCYAEIAADEREWLWLETVQLFIGIRGDKVECYDAEGNRMESYTEVKSARAEAESRIQELEDELRRLKAGN